ncbi:GTP-binding protein [Nonomuraea sp. NPDC004580]|uniref:GTP-binding protein n=1 Tax=Nonomuraea sp. NPDC004580 TaxID=3154552 RepID=UPI0033AF5179
MPAGPLALIRATAASTPILSTVLIARALSVSRTNRSRTASLPADATTEEIVTTVWRSRRPLHPGRFFEAVDELVTASVRSRGRFWPATRPGQLLARDAVAGIVPVEDAGPWLAALPEAAWALLSPARRVAAALGWHPEHGDRVQHLVFTGVTVQQQRRIAQAVKTAREMALLPYASRAEHQS